MPKIPQDKRIKAEFERLSKMFEGLPGNERDLLCPLIENASFMKVTLEDLQKQINLNGTTDEYKNGENQYGKKQSADLQSYNSTLKNYATLMFKLREKLPPETSGGKLEKLMNM